MRSIGIRELRQHASKYIRLVKDGETVEITERGEPVAMLTAIPKGEGVLDRLRREGRLTERKSRPNLRDIVPLPPKPGVPLPSVLVDQGREERI